MSKREEDGPGRDEELLPEGRALSLSRCYLQLIQHPSCGSAAHTVKQAGWSKAELTNLRFIFFDNECQHCFLDKIQVGWCVCPDTPPQTHSYAGGRLMLNTHAP